MEVYFKNISQPNKHFPSVKHGILCLKYSRFYYKTENVHVSIFVVDTVFLSSHKNLNTANRNLQNVLIRGNLVLKNKKLVSVKIVDIHFTNRNVASSPVRMNDTSMNNVKYL